jgi:predicted transposase YbfD/YdcC
MDGQASAPVLAAFKDIPDFRADHALHKLHDMIVIAICAVICGARGWVQVQIFGQAKKDWFSTFLDLPNGIPSHDTFSRVFAKLDPDAFETAFRAWMTALASKADGRIVAIDGKAIRRSFEHGWDKSGMATMVSAFCQRNSMVFGQIKVDGKSNEITAIPRLLSLLSLEGAVVTIDAIGCQSEIVQQIVDAGADYLLPVKENQPALYQAVKTLMDELDLEVTRPVKGVKPLPHGWFEQVGEQGHGRIETRRVLVTDQVIELKAEQRGHWKALASLAMVERERKDEGDPKGRVSIERHYYISSLKNEDLNALAEQTAGVARGHWSVENNLHWQLDVSFREDDRRIRKEHGAENFTRLCRIALNLLKLDRSQKVGIQSKQLLAGWDHDYLLHLITQ